MNLSQRLIDGLITANRDKFKVESELSIPIEEITEAKFRRLAAHYKELYASRDQQLYVSCDGETITFRPFDNYGSYDHPPVDYYELSGMMDKIDVAVASGAPSTVLQSAKDWQPRFIEVPKCLIPAGYKIKVLDFREQESQIMVLNKIN